MLDRSRWQRTTPHYITRGVPLEAFPWGHIGVGPSKASGQVLLETARGNPVLSVGSFGKGRVAAFAYPEQGLIPKVDSLWNTGYRYSYEEYMWSLLARTVAWTAKRPSEAAITQVESSPKGLAVQVEKLPDDARLEVQVRNAFDEIEAKMTAEVAEGAHAASLAFPETLSGGRHFAEVRLVGEKGVYDWATLTFERPAPTRIRSVELARTQVPVGEPISARLTLFAPQRTEATVRVRLFDNYERLIGEKRLRPTLHRESRHTVTIAPDSALTHLAKLDVEVLVEGRRSDRKIKEIFILQPRKWDDYDIAMYRFGQDLMPGVWPAIDRQLRRLNVTSLAAYSLEQSKHANYKVQAQTRISGMESPDGAARAYYLAMKEK